MVEPTSHTERTDYIEADVADDELGSLEAEESLYEALRKLQDARRSGDTEDWHAANYQIMRAYFQVKAEIEE